MRLLPIVVCLAVSGCGTEKPQRSPMVQREIDQCIAGMGGLVPDERQRKIACECTAEVMYDPKLDGDAEFKAMAKCRDKAGLDPNDPFDILDDGQKAASQAKPDEYVDNSDGYDDGGYPTEN